MHGVQILAGSHQRNVYFSAYTYPDAWRYRVSVETSKSGLRILWEGERARLIGSFYLTVAANTIVYDAIRKDEIHDTVAGSL